MDQKAMVLSCVIISHTRAPLHKTFCQTFFCHRKTLANLYANCNGNFFFAGVSWVFAVKNSGKSFMQLGPDHGVFGFQNFPASNIHLYFLCYIFLYISNSDIMSHSFISVSIMKKKKCKCANYSKQASSPLEFISYLFQMQRAHTKRIPKIQTWHIPSAFYLMK